MVFRNRLSSSAVCCNLLTRDSQSTFFADCLILEKNVRTWLIFNAWSVQKVAKIQAAAVRRKPTMGDLPEAWRYERTSWMEVSTPCLIRMSYWCALDFTSYFLCTCQGCVVRWRMPMKNMPIPRPSRFHSLDSWEGWGLVDLNFESAYIWLVFRAKICFFESELLICVGRR